MATSAQLEREAEAARTQIAAMLDELRRRMTPGQLVDELVDYARDSGGNEFVRNFGRQVVDNPLPVGLVGAGLAWLMMAGRGPTAGRERVSGGDGPRAGVSDMARRMGQGFGDAAEAARDQAASTMGSLSDMAVQTGEGLADAADQASARVTNLSAHAMRRARATAGRLNQSAAEAGASLQGTADAAGAAVRDTASAAYDAAAQRSRQGADAIAHGARAATDNLAATGRGFLAMLQEQPLVLAGLGLAIGGLLGASLPMTDTEDQLMGEASDAAKREAKAFATEQAEKGKAVAAEAWSAAKPALDEQLHPHADEQRSESSAERSRSASGHEATLVPSDHAGHGATAGEGARREAEHRSE